ncbi:MAG TPA: hypothetical protein VFL14_06430 [Xanthomonadales bacterium]|nr:hypothetical protein [Xanthomonadales bacterium]
MQLIPDLESNVVLGDVSWQHKGVEWLFAAAPDFCGAHEPCSTD